MKRLKVVDVYVDIKCIQYVRNPAVNVKCVLLYSVARLLVYFMTIHVIRKYKIESRYVERSLLHTRYCSADST
jgi:hypothetical protein